jgi:hypothetical protein
LVTAASLPLDLVARDDPEVLQDALQQILFRRERVQHQRGERRPIDLVEQRAAEGRLAGADVTGHHDEPFAALDGVLQQVERVGVRLAAIEILRVRRQAERLLGEPVVGLVHLFTLRAGPHPHAPATARSIACRAG